MANHANPDVEFLKSYLKKLQEIHKDFKHIDHQDLKSPDGPVQVSDDEERVARIADKHGFDGNCFRSLLDHLYPEHSYEDFAILRSHLRQQICMIPRIIAAVESADGGDIPFDDGFVAFGKLWEEKFDTYRKAKRFLDKNPEIRQRKPSSQRLEIHAGDWIRYWDKQKSEPTDADIDAHLAGYAERKAEVDQRSK